MSQKKLISLIIPVYNEEENIYPLYDAVIPIIDRCASLYNFELVFTDNHSSDSTFEKLTDLSLRDSRVRVCRFSRNFGYQKSILAGYLKANGDAIIQLDCDLQDPPELIFEFLKHWEQGYKVVYGIRISREEGAFIKFCRKVFYRVANYLSGGELPVDVGDFRLIDRNIVDVLRLTEDMQPYLRGMISCMGFKQCGIKYHRSSRVRGKSNFSFKDLLSLALDGIFNYSVIPLRLASFFGFSVSVITVACIIGYGLGKVIYGVDWPNGFTTLTILILTGISMNALFLGIIGEYLGRIYQQVKKKPLVIVEAELNAQAHPNVE